ncbi:MAG: hypothetical protein V1701_08985, partial [Planctomycetota bacterium]
MNIKTTGFRFKTATVLFLLIAALAFALDMPPEVQDAVNRWSKIRQEIPAYLENNQYKEALAILTDFSSKTMTGLNPRNYGNVAARSAVERLQMDVAAYLEDTSKTQSLLASAIKTLTDKPGSKITVGKSQIIVKKADENGIEGEVIGLEGAIYKKAWSDIPAKTIYSFFPSNFNTQIIPYKAVFCYTHQLVEEGDQALFSYIEKNPDGRELTDRILNVYHPSLRGKISSGGFICYQKRWMTGDDKEHMDKGDIKKDGEWISNDESMQRKGYVKVDGKWLTEKEAEFANNRKKNLENIRKSLAPKGIINRPGADRDSVAWDK